MSESAGLVVMLLNPQPGEHVLDACAAPGSKALFAATLMNSQVQHLYGCQLIYIN